MWRGEYGVVGVGALMCALLSVHAFADCGTVDLSNSPGYQEKKQTSQGGVGWCYAFSIADIVSQKLAAPVSPFDIAIRYNHFMGRTDSYSMMEGGGVALFLNNVFRADPGFCLESNYYDVGCWYSLKKAFLDDLSSFEAAKKIANEPDTKERADKIQHTLFFSDLFRNVDAAMAVQAAEHAEDQGQYIHALNAANCSKSVSASIQLDARWVSCMPDDWTCQWAEQETLQNFLDHGKMVSIGIDVFQLFTYKADLFTHFESTLFGVHEVTLVGKTQRGDRCFYKIHDSSNNDFYSCDYYRASKDMICNSDGTYEISEDQLGLALRDTVTVKD